MSKTATLRMYALVLSAVTAFYILWGTASYFLANPLPGNNELLYIGNAVGQFAFLIGSVGLFLAYTRNVMHKGKSWPVSVVFLISFLYFTFSGIFLGTDQKSNPLLYELYFIVGARGEASILIFMFIATAIASIKFVRVRSAMTAALVAGLFLMILTIIPLGNMISPLIPDVGNYLNLTVATGASNALLIALGVAAAIFMVRVLFLIERKVIGGD